MSLLSQFLARLTARERDQQSNADVEKIVRRMVQECLQEQAATDNREVMNSLVEVLRRRVVQPTEAQYDSELDDLLKKFRELNAATETQQPRRDELSRQDIREALEDILDLQGQTQRNPRSRTRENINSSDFVLPWCDGPKPDSQPKFAATGKRFSDGKVPINDAHNKNLGRGIGCFRRGTRRSFSQDETCRNNRPREVAPGPSNVPQANRGHGFHQHQHCLHGGGNMNLGAAQLVFAPRGNSTRGRGGYQRGVYNNRASSANRTVMKGSGADIRPNFSDTTAGLLPVPVAYIKNGLKYNVRNPKGREENETILSTNENKVFEGKLLSGTQSAAGGKKKKKNMMNSVRPEDTSTEAATGLHSGAAVCKNVKRTLGLGINQEVLKNIDGNQEIKYVILEAKSHGETRKLRPRTVGQLRGFLCLYPDAQAVVTIE